MKKEDFIVGRWYRYSGWYIKFAGEEKEGLFNASESITPSGNMYGGGNFGYLNEEKVLVEDLNEILKYLPDGHPDKTISYEIY